MMAEVEDNVVLPYCSVVLPAYTWNGTFIETTQPFKVSVKLSAGHTNVSAYTKFQTMAEAYWQAWMGYLPPPVHVRIILITL